MDREKEVVCSPQGYDDELEPSFVNVEFGMVRGERVVSGVEAVDLEEVKWEEMYRNVRHEFHWTCKSPFPSVSARALTVLYPT